MATPVLDRAALESLFGLGRRQTIRLMSTFGGPGYVTRSV
jgi:hypothetical protein